MMTHDFDSLLKEAVVLQKQKDLAQFRNTAPMPFREKFRRKMENLLKNPTRRTLPRRIISVLIAALVLLTCLGMALPQIRNSLRHPLLTVDWEFSAYAAELNNGSLHRITGSSQSGWIIESTDVYTAENKTLALDIPGLETIHWLDLSVTKSGFTLLGHDTAFRFLSLTWDGEILCDVRLPQVDEIAEDEINMDFHPALAGEMIVFSYSRGDNTSTRHLHILDPINMYHRYMGSNLLTCFTSGENLYFITENNQTVYSAEVVYPYTLYHLDSFDKEARALWNIDTLPYFISRDEPMCYDEDTGILYFTQNHNLVAADLKKQTHGIAMDVGSFFTVLQIDDGVLLYTSGQTYRVFRIPDGYFNITSRDQLTPIRIAEPGIFAVGEEAYPTVFRTMWEDNYNLYGTYIHTPDYENTILEKLRRGDSDFDIFYLDSSMAELLCPEFLTDLTQYPSLSSTYSDMRDGVRELCTVDGVTGLIPTSMYTMMMRRNSLFCTKEFQVPALLEELLPLKEAAVPYLTGGASFMAGSGVHTLLMPWFEQLADNYRVGNLTRKEAEDILINLFAITDSFAKDPNVWTSSGSALAKPYLICVQNKGTLTSLTSSWQPAVAPMIKVSASCAYTFTGKYYAVNPNSPYKKEAAVFLAYMTEYYRSTHQKPELGQLYRDYYPMAGDAGVNNIFLDQLRDSILSVEISGYSSRLSVITAEVTSGSITVRDAAAQTLAFIDSTFGN